MFLYLRGVIWSMIAVCRPVRTTYHSTPQIVSFSCTGDPVSLLHAWVRIEFNQHDAWVRIVIQSAWHNHCIIVVNSFLPVIYGLLPSPALGRNCSRSYLAMIHCSLQTLYTQRMNDIKHMLHLRDHIELSTTKRKWPCIYSCNFAK